MTSSNPKAGASRARFKVGVAGWSYPDWQGVFYPARRHKGFSELQFAARRFDLIEINSTFYRQPEARHAAAWVRQVEDLPDFVFTAKIYRELTHGTLSQSEIPALSRQFREGLKPLQEANRLACILLQFPWYFDDSGENRDRLERVADGLQPFPVAAELRHSSFLSQGPQGGLPFLGKLGINFVNIDLPRSRTSPGPTCINTGPLGYFRLHGRNSSTWFDPKADRDSKYNYLYRPDELRDLLPLMERVAQRTQSTYVVANNHFRGQAAANAFQIMQFSGREPPDIPVDLQAEFPFLGAS